MYKDLQVNYVLFFTYFKLKPHVSTNLVDCVYKILVKILDIKFHKISVVLSKDFP